MSPDRAYAGFFVVLALVAQYLPAKWGLPIGLAAIGLSVWQLGWVGWPLWLGIALASLIAWRLILLHGIFEKEISAKKEQAHNIHDRIMELDALLEKTKNRLSKDEEWQQNPETVKNHLL